MLHEIYVKANTFPEHHHHTDSRQLDAHEYSASDKRNDNENECKDKLQCAIEPWDVTGVGLVQDNEAQCTTSEEERGGQSFHYVLPVDPVLHKCHRPRMSLFICSGSDGRRLHYHVVYYASSDKKVREEDESKYDHGRRQGDEGWTLQFEIWNL